MRKNALARMYLELEKNGDIQVVMAKGKNFVSPEIMEEMNIKKEPYFGILAGAVLFRKEVFDIIGEFDGSTATANVDFLMRLKKFSIKVKKVNIISLDRRIHKTNFGRLNQSREYKDYSSVLRRNLGH
jgi:hypothetical protein